MFFVSKLVALSQQYSCPAEASKTGSATVTQQIGLEAGNQPIQKPQAVPGMSENLVYSLTQKVCAQHSMSSAADLKGTSSAASHQAATTGLGATSLPPHQSRRGQVTQPLHSAQKLKASSQPASRPQSQAKQPSQSAQQPQHAQQRQVSH
jgi:hypothetical protein